MLLFNVALEIIVLFVQQTKQKGFKNIYIYLCIVLYLRIGVWENFVVAFASFWSVGNDKLT